MALWAVLTWLAVPHTRGASHLLDNLGFTDKRTHADRNLDKTWRDLGKYLAGFPSSSNLEAMHKEIIEQRYIFCTVAAHTPHRLVPSLINP